MRNPTMTFGDMANCFNDIIPERKCKCYDLPSWSVERKPTKEELKENNNIYLVIEDQVFYYKPFIMTDIDGNEIGRF